MLLAVPTYLLLSIFGLVILFVLVAGSLILIYNARARREGAGNDDETTDKVKKIES